MASAGTDGGKLGEGAHAGEEGVAPGEEGVAPPSLRGAGGALQVPEAGNKWFPLFLCYAKER